MRNGSGQGLADVVPLSNRRGTGLKNRPESCGVDRLSLSFPITEWEPDPTAWDSVTIRQAGDRPAVKANGHVVTRSGTKAFVGAAQVDNPAAPLWAKVEFNPSRVADPEGYSLAAPEAVPAMIEEVIGLADGELFLRPEGASIEHDVRVKRCDVARDFEKVADVSARLGALAPVPRPWARRNLLHNDPGRRGAQTLMVGSGAGHVRAYDKHAETDGQAPEGTLRWEVEGRRGWLTNYGDIDRVADLTPEKLYGFAINRWEWSAMGSEVTTGNKVVELVAELDLTPARRRAFLGYLMEQAYGLPSSLAKQTASDYRRMQRELGLVLGPESFGVGGDVVVRLDFETGREVYRAA